MKINGYEITDNQKKEILSEFIIHPILYMYNDLSKIEQFLDDNKYIVIPSNDKIKIYFTELNSAILIQDN